MSKWVIATAVIAVIGLAVLLHIPLVDDGQLQYSNVTPECLELHTLKHCQEDQAIISYWDSETATIKTGHLWEVKGSDRRIDDTCEVLGTSDANKWVECPLRSN